MEKKEKKKGMGRKKIEIKKIENSSRLMVTFTKRRGGLFKKAAQLSAMCGANVAVIVKSPNAGRIHSFGTPSVDAVLNRFLYQNPSDHHDQEVMDKCKGKKDEEEKVMEDRDRVWWDAGIDELGLNELEEYMTALEGLRENVVARANEMTMASACSSNEMPMTTAYSYIDPFSDGLEFDFTESDLDFLNQIINN
ncbi:agamous-like MADS-box protein AGL62 [Cornus florida]|uniref:agamous-like MADS-box protein AGL62 n=1 Tax=Cornus florida TaxID=4283 RepID=UPI00289944DB|nr:agamous-like MADS-box protein AGL62 [Cornus florida]